MRSGDRLKYISEVNLWNVCFSLPGGGLDEVIMCSNGLGGAEPFGGTVRNHSTAKFLSRVSLI